MRKIIKMLCIMVVLLALFSCHPAMNAPTNTTSSSDSEALDQWIDQDLVPKIVARITSDRDLKYLPFIIVGWDVDQQSIKTEVDALTKEVREKIVNVLLARGEGVNMVVRSGVKPLDMTHHANLEDVPCNDYQDVGMMVLLTARIAPLTGKLQLQVKGGVLRGGRLSFIDGFSENFECDSSEKLKSLLDKSKTDEYLRGLRYLPFETGQKDLLASYLATRTSCIFRELPEAENYKVFMDRSGIGNDQYLQNVFTMIEMYLDRFREIEIVMENNKANITLYCKAVRVNDELNQVWVTTGRKKIGASVEAYVKKK
ncbi:MAG: hypothetical protein DRH07_11770 [Deltaproteobacteria bacterium]|nr:MAG: hypothetical protein DRH07_11770 [Deltaproteobacteria bacterium]